MVSFSPQTCRRDWFWSAAAPPVCDSVNVNLSLFLNLSFFFYVCLKSLYFFKQKKQKTDEETRQEGMRFKSAVASGSASFSSSFLMSSCVHCLREKPGRLCTRRRVNPHITSSSCLHSGASLPQQFVYSPLPFHVSLCSFFFF